LSVEKNEVEIYLNWMSIVTLPLFSENIQSLLQQQIAGIRQYQLNEALDHFLETDAVK
jgi:hypothetical protein